MNEKRTYGQLRSSLPGVSEPIPAKQLRELIADGLIVKTTLSTKPHRTEYELADLGPSLSPLLRELSAWGLKNKKRSDTAGNSSVSV